MLTVMLATRNRSQLLHSSLQSFAALREPRGGWKLVVVDNGSTDATGEVLSGMTAALPLTALREPRPGKNAALNRGLAEAEGDLVVFSDDDVFPWSDWLVEMRDAADANPQFDIFGGKVLPRWEAPPPPPLAALDPAPLYAVTPESLVEGEINAGLVFGPNMAIRASAFSQGFRFDETIGPKGANYPMGSETELTLRLAREGRRAWHAPSACVEHYVRAEQFSREWIFQRAIRFGRGQFRMNPSRKLWFGMPRHLARDVPLEYLRMIRARLLRRTTESLRAEWNLGVLLGTAIEGRHARRHSATIAVAPR